LMPVHKFPWNNKWSWSLLLILLLSLSCCVIWNVM
jgi:hypothetical protein